jgi:hypothetical protein
LGGGLKGLNPREVEEGLLEGLELGARLEEGRELAAEPLGWRRGGGGEGGERQEQAQGEQRQAP